MTRDSNEGACAHKISFLLVANSFITLSMLISAASLPVVLSLFSKKKEGKRAPQRSGFKGLHRLKSPRRVHFRSLCEDQVYRVIFNRLSRTGHTDVKISAFPGGQYFSPNYFHNSNEKLGKNLNFHDIMNHNL